MPSQLFGPLHKIACFSFPKGPNYHPQRRVAASPLARRWIFKKRSLFRKVASDLNVTLLNFGPLLSRWRARTVQNSSPKKGFLKIVHQRFTCAFAYERRSLCVTAPSQREIRAG
jgi:hypothetical protein